MRIHGGGLPSVYKALQFHLHWGEDAGPGSEHTVDGERYPMEVNLLTFILMQRAADSVPLLFVIKLRCIEKTLSSVLTVYCVSVCVSLLMYVCVCNCLFPSLKLHVVHIKEEYQTLEEAENDRTGIAVLAFFFEVLLS